MNFSRMCRDVKSAFCAPLIDPGTSVYCPWCRRDEKVLVTRHGLERHLDIDNQFVCIGSGQWVTLSSGCRVIKFSDWLRAID